VMQRLMQEHDIFHDIPARIQAARDRGIRTSEFVLLVIDAAGVIMTECARAAFGGRESSPLRTHVPTPFPRPTSLAIARSYKALVRFCEKATHPEARTLDAGRVAVARHQRKSIALGRLQEAVPEPWMASKITCDASRCVEMTFCLQAAEHWGRLESIWTSAPEAFGGDSGRPRKALSAAVLADAVYEALLAVQSLLRS
jgi:hypothetical protein